jgi:uncharacterized membrane protein YkvA (DUF1232 family)
VAGSMRRKAAFSALFSALRAVRGGPSMGTRLAAVPRMIAATVRGEYDGAGRLGMMAAAAVYVISPVDLVPEAFLFVLGLADDAVVITWLAGAVIAETERYLGWERLRAPARHPRPAHR